MSVPGCLCKSGPRNSRVTVCSAVWIGTIKMKEREVEKQVCQVLWEAFNDFFDATDNRDDIRLLDHLRDDLIEAMPYGPEEVRDV